MSDTCKEILIGAAISAQQKLNQPEVDVHTVARQMQQSSTLVLAELEGRRPQDTAPVEFVLPRLA